MDVSTTEGFRQRPRWLLIVMLLLIGQAWLTLRLFSTDYSFERLLNDDSVVSGRHALYEYHGWIGAKSWQDKRVSCCFDPAYQAGYPKTPVFDGGSRPAELFQLLGGLRPASYKFGLAIACFLVPLAFIGMGRGISMTVPASCVAGLLGGILWWSAPCQDLLLAGDVDLLFGGLCLLLHLTWFIRFERLPGLDSWLVMTFFAAVAWYTQPFLVVGCLPFLMLYYLWVATRQGPIWHLAMIAAVLVSFGINAAWLIEWGKHLWLYLPFGGQAPPSAPFWPTLSRQWSTLMPSDPVHLGVAAVGMFGLLCMLRSNRAAAWLLGLGVAEFVLLTVAGRFWPLLLDFGSEKLLLLAAWCLVLPAAYVLSGIAEHLGNASGFHPLGALWLMVGLVGLAWGVDLPRHWMNRSPLEIGLSSSRVAIVRGLGEATTADARILWEDRKGIAMGWTALLAMRTQRPFLGGLDPEGRVEHMYARLCDGKLADRSVRLWNDEQLRQFADRYNIGWIVCWTPDSIERFRAFPQAREVTEFTEGGKGILFELRRKPNYFLKGRGRLEQADVRRIALADLEPEDGEVILSMHYQAKMRVYPGYVQVERDLDLDDPIPFIRLRCLGPVARLTIIWESP